MRLEVFESLDELLDEMVNVFLSHNGELPMDWTPKRQSSLFNLSKTYPNKIINLCKNISYDDLEKIKINPSQLMKSAYKFQVMTKSLDYDTEIKCKTFFFLCNCSIIARKNLVTKRLENLKQTDLIAADSTNIKRLVGFLNAGLRALSEALYCDDHTIGGEIVGPLKFGNGNLIIRDYHRLRPCDLHNYLEDFKIKAVRTFCVYGDDSINIDMNGNLMSSNNMVSSLSAFCIEVTDINDKTIFIPTSGIQELLDYIDKWLLKVMAQYREKNDDEKKELLIVNEYYALKPLFDFAHMDWYDESVSNSFIPADDKYIEINIRNRKKLFEANDMNSKKLYARQLLDPRIKWR